MDQFYVDSAYWDAYYATYQAEAEIGLGPYFASDYFEGDYFENSGIVSSMAITAIKVKDCSASLTAESTVVCDATKIAGGVAVFGYSDVEAFATISATISHIHGSDMFAFGEATLAAQVERIRDINLDASASFSTAIDAVRGIYVSAQSDSAFDIAIANLRVRNTEAAVDAAFSLAATVSTSGSSAVEISSEFTQTVSADKLVPGAASLTDSLTLTASIDGTLEASSAITSQSTVSATISHIHGADLSAFGNASLGANFDRIRSFDSQLDVQNQLDATVERIQQGAASLTSEVSIIMVTGMFQQGMAELTGAFSPVVTCQVTTNTFAVLDATASLEALGELTKGMSSSIEVVASTSITADRSRNLDISIDASSSLDATAINLQGFDAAITSQASGSAIIGSIKQFEVAESALFTPGFTCEVITNTFAVLEAVSSLSASANEFQSLSAGISSASSLAVDAVRVKSSAVSIASTSSLTASGNYQNKRPWLLTASSSTAFSSSTKVTGTHSLNLTSNTSYAFYPTPANFRLPAAGTDFVIELFANISSNPASKLIVSSGVDGSAWAIRVDSSSKLRFTWFDTANVQEQSIGGTYTLAYPAWHFIRVKRVGSTITLEYSKLTGSTWSTITQVGSGTSSYQGKLVAGNAGLVFGDVSGSSYAIPGYYDEFYMAKGTTSGGQTQATLGTKLTSGKNDTTVALMHFDNDFVDDITGIALGQAALTSTATISSIANKQASGLAQLYSNAYQHANYHKIANASASLQVNGFTVAAVGRIQAETADLDSQFVMTALGGLLVTADASLSASTSLTAVGRDVDLASANLTASFALTAFAREIPADAYIVSTTEALLHFDAFPLVDTMRSGTPTLLKNGVPSTDYPSLVSGKFSNSFTTGQTYQWREQTSIDLRDGASYTLDFWYKESGSALLNTDPEIISVEWGGTKATSGPTTFDSPAKINTYHTARHSGNPWSGLTEGQIYLNWLETYEAAPPSDQVVDYVISQDTWYHFTIARQKVDATTSLFKLYINGQLEHQFTKEHNLAPYLYPSTTTAYVYTGNTVYPNITDEVRLVKGRTISANFTPPTSAYTEVSPFALEGLVDLTSSASLELDFLKVKPAAADISATASLSGSITRTRASAVSLTTSISLTAQGLKAATLASQMSTQVVLTAPAVKTTDTGLTAQVTASQATLTANSRIRATAVALPVTAVQSAQATITRTVESNQFVQATVLATVLRIKSTTANLQVEGSEVTIAYKVGQGLIHSDIVATMSCEPVKITDINSNLQVDSAQATLVTKTTDYTASLTAEASLTAGVDYLRRNEVFVTASFTQLSQAVKTTSTTSQASVTTELTALTDNSRIARVTAGLSTQASLTANNDTLRRTLVALTTTTELNAVPGIFVRTGADLQVNGFVLAAGRKISFDRYLQLEIKPESRALTVLQETRAVTIASETRLNIIKGYPL